MTLIQARVAHIYCHIAAAKLVAISSSDNDSNSAIEGHTDRGMAKRMGEGMQGREAMMMGACKTVDLT